MNKRRSNEERFKRGQSCLMISFVLLFLIVGVGYYYISNKVNHSLKNFSESMEKLFLKKEKEPISKEAKKQARVGDQDLSFIAEDSTFYLAYPNDLIIDDNGYIKVEGDKYNALGIKKMILGGLGHNDFNYNRFPIEVFAFKNLEYLNLNMRGFKTIPQDIVDLKKLKILDLQHTAVQQLPDNFAQLENLEELVLLFSDINRLPDGMENMHNLKKLNLMCTKFEKIPPQLFKLKQLNTLLLKNVKECEDQSLKYYNTDDLQKLYKMLPNTWINERT